MNTCPSRVVNTVATATKVGVVVTLIERLHPSSEQQNTLVPQDSPGKEQIDKEEIN